MRSPSLIRAVLLIMIALPPASGAQGAAGSNQIGGEVGPPKVRARSTADSAGPPSGIPLP